MTPPRRNAAAVALIASVLLSTTAAWAAQPADWELVRSMKSTFTGPDVGEAYGHLLLMDVAFADANRGVIGGFNDPSDIRHHTGAEGVVGYTADGGRTFHTLKTKSHIWAVGHEAGGSFWALGPGVLRSDDAGKTWERAGGGGGSTAAQFRFGKKGRGLLASGNLYRLDEKNAFQALTTPAKDLRAVAMGTGKFGVAAGDHGNLLITRDGGNTWTLCPDWRTGGRNRHPNYFRGAAAGGEGSAWIVGDNGIVIRTTDAGESFDVKHIGEGDFLTAVRFADARRGWAMSTHHVYRTDDGGDTWTKQPTAGGVSMQGLSILDADTAWIAGHYGVIQHTTDAGKTWRTLNDYSDLYAVTMIDDKVGFAGAESGGILKTTDGGRTWAFCHALRGSAVEALHFRDAKTGWAVGDFGHVAYTTDGGATWRRGKIDFRDILKDVQFPDARSGVAVGARGAVFTSADAGATWRRVFTPTRKLLYAVDFPTAEIGYACGDGVVLKTADGGATWKELPSPTIDILSDVRFTTADDGLMVGDVGQIYTTADGGATWRRSPVPVRHWLHRIEILDDKTLLVAGSRGTLLRSSDGGATWAALQSGTVRNVYCISRHVAVGRWGTVQLLKPGVNLRAPMPAPAPLGPKNLLPKLVWRRLPAGAARGSAEIGPNGRLLSVTVNGRTYPTDGRFPKFTVATLEGRKIADVKTLYPDDKSWKITPVDAPKGQKAFDFDNDLLTVRLNYQFRPHRLVVTATVLAEKAGRLLSFSTGDGKFLRLMGDSADVMRNGALVVPVDGGERIPFVGAMGDRPMLQKWNYLHGWYFKNRMIGFVDGKAGVVLRSHQWHSVFFYGQSALRRGPLPESYLYLGLAFDTRTRSPGHVRDLLKNKGDKDLPVPAWLDDPLAIDTFGFDLQFVGDVNDDARVDWVDAGITYRDLNFPRSERMDQSPGMCDDFAQTRVAFNWGYILWSTPWMGNTHSDIRAHKMRHDGRMALEWGHFSRSIAYETASGRMARFFDKQADECDFPPTPAYIGADTWTCGLGGTDYSPTHFGTAEESARAKVAVLRMLARRGFVTHSEALSEWGLDGYMHWGWWTPYVGGGAWLGGFSRCWEYSPTAHGGPLRSHLFSDPIPLQAVIHQGMLYWGSGHNGPPGYAILHGCRPNEGGMSGVRHNAYFYYPWLVLWKTVSPHPIKNVRDLKRGLWEVTYRDGGVLTIDVRGNTWVYRKDGITYDGYSPPNPHRDPIRPTPRFTWGIPFDKYGTMYRKGSFGVWRSGTFTIKVPGIRAVKPPKVIGAPDKDQAPPKYTAKFADGILTVTIQDKDPKLHPMLIFDPAEPAKPAK